MKIAEIDFEGLKISSKYVKIKAFFYYKLFIV